MPARAEFHPVETALVAVVTAAWTALPDYAARGRALTLARGVLLAGVLGVVTVNGLRLSRADELAHEAADGVVPEAEAHPSPSARKAALIVGGAVAVSVLSWQGRRRLTPALVDRLRTRGVRRPWTVVGLGRGLLSVGWSVARSRIDPATVRALVS